MNSPLQSFTNGIKAIGLLFILAGVGVFVLALLMPNLVGLLVAILFMVSGGFRIVYAVLSRGEVGFWFTLATGILYAAAGLILLTGLLQAYASVSVILGIVLILEGVLDLALGLKLSPGPSRNWFLVSSGIALVLGILFASGLATGAAWLLGVLAGLSLATPGVWFMLLAQSIVPARAVEKTNFRPRR